MVGHIPFDTTYIKWHTQQYYYLKQLHTNPCSKRLKTCTGRKTHSLLGSGTFVGERNETEEYTVDLKQSVKFIFKKKSKTNTKKYDLGKKPG